MNTDQYWLSEFTGRDVVVICPDKRCGVNWRHDVDDLIARRGDRQLRGVTVSVCRAAGCRLISAVGMRPCLARIEITAKRQTTATVPVKPLKGGQHLVPVGDRKLKSLREWEVLFGVCVCGHLKFVDRHKLIARHGGDAELQSLATGLTCKACGNKTGNAFAVVWMPR